MRQLSPVGDSCRLCARVISPTDSYLIIQKYRHAQCNFRSGGVRRSSISSSISFEKRRTLKKEFVESQFNYCPLIWMLHSRTLNNKINHIHERALRNVHSDYKSSFNEILDRGGSFTIHQKMCNV